VSKEQDQLRRRLERATAAEFTADELPSDAETALLREGWVALGQLLETAYPAGEQPLDLPSLPSRKTAAWRNPAVVAALVASLLVVATLAWSLMSTDGPGNPHQIVDRENGTTPTVKKESPLPDSDTVPDSDVPEPDELQWDDSFDEQLAMAGEDVIRIQEDWYGLDDAFGPIEAGLKQIAEDIESDSL